MSNIQAKRRVVIITMGISKILEEVVNSHDVVGIVECALRKKNNNNVKNKIFKSLLFIYKTIKGKNLRGYCLRRKIPYYYMDNGSDKQLENWVKEKKPEVIVVYSMSQLLKKNIFSIPKYGTINLHPSLLPNYRGPNPIFWMYYDMAREGGVTVHFIDEGEDTGDIIYQESFEIPLGLKVHKLRSLIEEIGAKLILKALDNIEDLPRIPQPKKSPTRRARNVTPEEIKGMIDWDNWNIERIWHILRGTEGWLDVLEGPKGIYKGQTWIIKNFKKCDMKAYKVSHIYKENNKYFIACRDGKIFLDKKISIKNLLRQILGIR